MTQHPTNGDTSPSRVDLRDTFAAAALTGLLSRSIAPEQAMSQYVRIAAAYADAMLRERERTNHDAVPEAKATNNGGTPKDADGTGSTPSKAEIDALEFVVEEGRIASMDDCGILRSWLIRLRPEWENQSYEESDEKRTNTNMNWVEDEIAIEAAWDRTGLKPTWPEDEAGCGVKSANAMADEIERLRLTDDELDAIEHGLERLELHSDTESEQSAVALRSLLARLAVK